MYSLRDFFYTGYIIERKLQTECMEISKLSRSTLIGPLQNTSRMLVTGKIDIFGEAELILVLVLPEKPEGHILKNAKVKC